MEVFARDERWNVGQSVIRFELVMRAADGTRTAPCRMAEAALRALSGSPTGRDLLGLMTENEALQLFAAHRSAIEAVAGRKHKAGAFEADGSLVIGSGDLSG